MEKESSFSDAVRATAHDSARQTLVTLVVIALLVAVIFGAFRLALHFAEPFVPMHEPLRGAIGETRR